MCAEKKTLECPNKRKQKSKEYLKYKRYINGKKFRELRKLVFERDGYKCQLCNSSENLTVHHKTYDNLYNEENHLEDLITLCYICHCAIHKNKKNNDFKNK